MEVKIPFSGCQEGRAESLPQAGGLPHRRLLIVLFLAVSSLAQAPEFDRVSRLATEARDAARIPEAITLYRQALQLNAKWEEGWWYLGTLLYSTDQSGEAADAFTRLLNLRAKDDGTGWAFLGLCYFETKEYDKAITALKQARARWAADNAQLLLMARFHLGILLNRSGSHQQAYDLLGVLARENHDDPAIIAALGASVLLIPKLPAEIPADKQDVVIMAGRAAFLASQARKEEAKAAYLDVIKRYPGEPNVHYALGAFLMEADADAALKEFRRELESNPSCAYARVQIALNLLQTGEYEAAAVEARKASELSPQWFMPRLALGRALLEIGKTSEAIQELEASTKLAADAPQAHFQLARAYRKAGRAADAVREETEFRRLNEIDRTTRLGAAAGAAKTGGR